MLRPFTNVLDAAPVGLAVTAPPETVGEAEVVSIRVVEGTTVVGVSPEIVVVVVRVVAGLVEPGSPAAPAGHVEEGAGGVGAEPVATMRDMQLLV
jgi:hypothetical protein